MMGTSKSVFTEVLMLTSDPIAFLGPIIGGSCRLEGSKDIIVVVIGTWKAADISSAGTFGPTCLQWLTDDDCTIHQTSITLSKRV